MSTAYAKNIGVCFRCPDRQKGCGGPCACTLDGRDIAVRAAVGDCPKHERPHLNALTHASPQPVQVTVPTKEERGRKLWAELHERAARPVTIDREVELVWLDDFAKRVPCGECRTHWRELVEKYPPVLDSWADYWVWTWRLHNHVNARLDKPRMTLADAQALYLMGGDS